MLMDQHCLHLGERDAQAIGKVADELGFGTAQIPDYLRLPGARVEYECFSIAFRDLGHFAIHKLHGHKQEVHFHLYLNSTTEQKFCYQ